MHFRAPPDVRGSGKERGHGTELKFCPKCGKELKPGKHHVGCSAGKSAPRQAAKRQRQMSSTTESDWVSQTSTASLGDEQSDSWEDTVRRRVSKVQHQRSLDEETISRRIPQGQYGSSGGGVTGGSAQGFAPVEDVHCRVNRMQQMLTEGDHNAELVFTANTMADVGLILRHGVGGGGGDDAVNRGDGTASPSPSLAKLLDNVDAPVDLVSAPLLRVPSPPPLPPDWDATNLGGGGHTSLLFDFDQFDANRRTTLDGLAEPIMTVTSAMNPLEVSNPSDDYIWQIMFAGENEMPRRVTAHLHHVESDANDDLMLKLLNDEEHHEQQQHGTVYDEGIKWVDPAIAAVTTNVVSGNAVNAVEGNLNNANGNGNGNGTNGPGNGSMQPPPSRSPIDPILLGPDGLANLPPPPSEALAAAEHAQQPQTITVTYVVQPGSGPEGLPQYSVKSIRPAVENSDAVAVAGAPEQLEQQQ